MYKKEVYVFDQRFPKKLTIRSYNEKDFDQLIDVQKQCFPPPFPSELWWNKDQLKNHITLFPMGALCAVVDSRIVGSMTTLIVPFSPHEPKHTWEEITDNGYITTHTSDGNTLYVVDICVSPDYRKLKIGKWLMQSMYEVVTHLNLDRLIGGGRIPNYYRFQKELTPENYVNEVLKGNLKDPVMSFLLSCGRTPLCLVENYLEDKESCNYGVLMEWKNPFKNFNHEADY
ncbi:GNAT family N-acetyltransferase [Metabacillus arenae]|uniref:GNAT family N-acetyltransferase n=1 Tax=Metabacillus arenae TaxID=2771434 RepID=A0A926RZX6_9BACI|nr:GNAT family N-acetyltransferase [Metabacillus arenae]MBD1383300.1 GNAT family N-acetyltransferase [Metabacillus arenae]